MEWVNIGDEKLFRLVEFLNFSTIEEVEKYLNKTTRENLIEGVVVKYYINNACHRFKWKTQAYLDVHWTRQKLSRRTIFKALSKSDEDAEEMRDKIAEEHHLKFDKIVKEYRQKVISAINRAKTLLRDYQNYIKEGCLYDNQNYIKEGRLYDNKDRLVAWLDRVLMDDKTRKRDKSLVLKAYRDGMDNFEKKWVQEKKPTKPNRDRQFLFNYVSADKS